MNLPPYKTFPTIVSESLILRQILVEDMKDVLEISFYDGKLAETLEEAWDMQLRINADYQQGNSIHWGIADKTSNEIMGTLGYYRGFEGERGELGCVLRPKFRGQGIMTQALELATAFGLKEMGLKNVFAITTLENRKAIQLLERFGFKQGILLEDQEVEYFL